MSDEDKQDKKKSVLIRIEEWAAWLPARPGENVAATSGVTGFEMFEHEKLLEVAVSATSQKRFIPMDNGDGETQNVQHGLYAFQAVMATTIDGPIPEGPDPNKVAPLPIVEPGHKNRAERRKK